MKQMIYRRAGGASTSTGGYAVTARADSISAMQRSEAQKHARIPALSDENIKHKVSFFRQYQLDADTLAVSCGFYDPHDPRGSAIVQTAMTEDRAERARYLSRLPVTSGYFDAVKAAYTQSGEFEIEKGDMMLPLEDYFSAATSSRADALNVIRKELGSEDTMREMFAALLDAASSNPRMIVAFMDAQDLVQVGERGRRLAEALLSCLPDSVAAAIGYMSPALDDSENTTFGLRFALRSNFKFAGAQTQAYTFDLPAGDVIKPRTADSGAEEYVRELAALVMQGDDAALKRIDELRAAMEDPSCFKPKEKLKGKPAPAIPSQMSIRYALVTRPDRLESAEVRRVLDWRHTMIDEALVKNSAGFGPFGFWTRVNEWVLNVCLPDMWANQSGWKKGSQVYDPDVALRVFDDSQRLHAAGRSEAIGYKEFVANKLAAGQLYADNQILLDRLIKYFKNCADGSARSGAIVPLRSHLYFDPVENWMRTVWLAMRPAPRSRDVLASVEQLYAAGALEPEKLQTYVDGYSELIFDGRDGLFVMGESRFHAAVVQAVAKNNPARLAVSMRADLRGKNPYASAGSMPVWQWYRRLTTQANGLEGEYLSMNRENLENALARTGFDGIPALADELRGAGLGMIACASRLDAGLNAREMIERRIAALSKNSGVGMYYPERIELAGTVSAILEKYEGGGWMKAHEALSDVCSMKPGRLTMADFDRFAEIAGSDMRSGVVDRARELLDQAMCRAWPNPADAPMESVLTGICMLTLNVSRSGGLCFNPERAASQLDKLGVREQKLAAYCKKHADADASDGVGYLADVMLSHLKTSEKKRTGESVAYPKVRSASGNRKRRAPLARMPVAVPIVGIVVFAGGLAASTFGLLNYIGLL